VGANLVFDGLNDVHFGWNLLTRGVVEPVVNS